MHSGIAAALRIYITEDEWKRIYRDYELTTATIHYNSSDVPSAKVKITAFTVTKTDSCRIAELSAENIPEGAAVYIAAYTADGKVAEIRKSVPENGNVRAQFPLGGAYKFKAYIWDNSYRPLCEGKTVSELAEAPATETDITETNVCVNANNVKAGSTIIVAAYKADRLVSVQSEIYNGTDGKVLFDLPNAYETMKIMV